MIRRVAMGGAAFGPFLLLLGPPAWAQDDEATCERECFCSFGPTEPGCAVALAAHEDECATCTCGAGGCASSSLEEIGDGGAVLTASARLEISQATLAGVQEHLEAMLEGWTVRLSETVGGPRLSKHYAPGALAKLLDEVAGDHLSCAEVDAARRTITFRPAGRCGRPS